MADTEIITPVPPAPMSWNDTVLYLLNLIATSGGGGGSSTFIGLTDVPASYVGASLQSVRVNVGETGLEFFTPSGGGSVLYPDQNILIVDPILTADGVKVFNTIAAARTYALTQTPSATNPYQIVVAGGQFADGIIITPYIAYQLQPNTRIDGAITSVFGFADVAAADYSFIEGGNLTNVTGSAGAFFTFFNNSVISGGVGVASIFVFNKCSIRYIDLSAVGLTAIALGDCYISSGEFRGLSATRATFNNNFGGSGVNIMSGTFTNCIFEAVNIQDFAGTQSFFGCFFSETQTVWPTYTGAGSVNIIGCTTNNAHTIAFASGSSPNIWKENVNLLYSKDSETFSPNQLKHSGGRVYYQSEIQFGTVATNAGASLTYSDYVKDFIPTSARINNIAIQLNASFAGTGITSLLLDIGTSTNPTAYYTGYDLMQAASNTSFIDIAINSIQNIGVNTDIYLTFTAVGANLDQLTNGDFFFKATYESEDGL